MHAPKGYALKKAVRATARAEVYLAVRAEDNAEVLLKAYRDDAAGGRRSQAEREYDALRAVRGPGVPEVLDLVTSAHPPVLVMERFAGLSLDTWVETRTPSVAVLLDLAVQLTRVLVRVHEARLIHRDITPHNVLFDPERASAALIDFGSAQPLGAQARPSRGSEASRDFAGALHYVAPEQTGRMNRGVDTRSDLYSLGATLYLAATGQPPFPIRDPLALLHAHMAVRPEAPVSLRPDLPSAISRLILKLLEKEPGSRYQSAQGLLADLRTCQDQLAQHAAIDPDLALGTAEVPDRPRFPRRIYGREAELTRLRQCYATAAAGCPQILLLAGEPGSGKSALVDGLRPELAGTAGYLAIGKFDVSHDRPYGAWTTALEALVEQRLVESEERLQAWRDELRTSLGGIAQAALDLVPALRFVLGEVPTVPALGPRETQARLGLALQRLVTASATQEHPLVLLLDDLQWSDAASRALLEDLLGHLSGGALLLIAAYRSNEMTADHPVAAFLARLAERGTPIQQIELGPLGAEATVAVLADALERPADAVRSLAELVERKTSNAPLLVRQFVDHLHEKGLLRYAVGSGWLWDHAAVAAAEIPEGAVELMMAKLHRLDPEPRRAIELVSAVGDEFDLDLLCELSVLERPVLERGLYALCDAGLIDPCASGFRFAHDRVREAARALLPAEARTRLHHDIAAVLRNRLSPAEQSARVLEIAEHMNAGIEHLSPADRLPALILNLMAGKAALAAGAASTAQSCLRSGCQLLRPEDWQSQQGLAFDLLLQSIECAVLRRDLESALALADTLDEQSLSPLQSAMVAAKRIHALALLRTPEECVHYALGVLRRFGIRWPLHPSRGRAVWALRRTLWELRLRGIPSALRPAASSDPQRLAAMLVLGTAGPIFLRVSAYLTALVTSWAVRSNLRRGAVARAAYSLGIFGSHLEFVLGDSAWAQRVTAQAAQAPTLDPIWTRYEMQHFAQVRPWWTPRRDALAPLDRIAETLHELGDLEFYYYARFQKTAFLALAGDPVKRTASKLGDLAESIRRAGHRYPEPEHFLRPYRLLAWAESKPIPFEAELAASDAEIARERGTGEPYTRTAWLLVLCIHGRWDLAFAQAELLGDRLLWSVPFVQVTHHTFYRGLAAAAQAESSRGAARRKLRRVLRESLRRLRRWRASGPDFAHMALLLAAEEAALAGHFARARSLYSESAHRATESEFPHHTALAHERRSRLFARAGRRTEAAAPLGEAIRGYRQWGCEAKALALESEFPSLRQR